MSDIPDLLHVARPMRCNVQQHPAPSAVVQAAIPTATPLKSLALKVLARNRACNDRAIKGEKAGKGVQQRPASTPAVVALPVALTSMLAELNGLLARLARVAGTQVFNQVVADEAAVRALEDALHRIQVLAEAAKGSGFSI